MKLGAFSISLAVQDLAASVAFYEKLGFVGGGGGEKWTILKNGDTVIGLFEGMFEANILTFNPGWTQGAEEAEDWQDVRSIEAELRSRGLEPTSSNTADKPEGPAHITLVDPDGNAILIDQHR
jgi:catechol 2,3-dioxygenase-like lactoylglutathione lyase family enzyme